MLLIAFLTGHLHAALLVLDSFPAIPFALYFDRRRFARAVGFVVFALRLFTTLIPSALRVLSYSIQLVHPSPLPYLQCRSSAPIDFTFFPFTLSLLCPTSCLLRRSPVHLFACKVIALFTTSVYCQLHGYKRSADAVLHLFLFCLL